MLSSICNANSTTAVYITFEVSLRSDTLDILGQVSILSSFSFVTCKPSPPQPRWPCARVLACFPQAFADAVHLLWAPQALPLPPSPSCCQTTVAIAGASYPFYSPVHNSTGRSQKTRAGFCAKHFKSFLYLSVWTNVWIPLCGINSAHDVGICASWEVDLSICGWSMFFKRIFL